MEIHWKRKKLYEVVQKYAKSNAITARRMISIKAANNYLDLRPDSMGRAHFLEGEYEGCFSLDLERKGNGKRLICVPCGDFKKSGDQYVTETITEFEVLEITDYHK